jgi:hypothetical protein
MAEPVKECPRCGSVLRPEDRYCPRCGERVSAPDPSPAAAPVTPARPVAEESSAAAASATPGAGKRGRFVWLWVLIGIGLLGLLAFLALSQFPREDEDGLERQDSVVETSPVIEETAVQETGTIIEIREESGVGEQDLVEVQVAPRTGEFSRRPPPEGRVSEAQAVSTLLAWVRTNDHYQAADDCIRPRSLGFRNRGYTIELISACDSDRLLGRWRVDTLTGRVYEQKADGRYLSP